MDALRARMVREGYQLEGFTRKEREQVWYSLARKTRQSQLATLLGVPEATLSDLVAQVRRDRYQRTGNR